MKRLYKTQSGMERGTLFQLRNLIHRSNVSSNPKKDTNAAEDFLEVVVTGYVISTVMAFLGMSSLDNIPLSIDVPSTGEGIESIAIWMEDDSIRKSILQEISEHIVNQHIDLAAEFKDPKPEDAKNTAKGTTAKAPASKGTAPQTGAGKASAPQASGSSTAPRKSAAPQAKGEKGAKKKAAKTAYEYTREVLSLGLLFLNFKDAVREGDGDRVLLMWKYFMLIFKASGRKNYAAEAFSLLSQYHITLPPNLAEQLKWSRFVNMHDLKGHNISCDLHMEHMNRQIQTVVGGLGANKTPKAIIRVGKAIGVLSSVTDRLMLK